MPNSKQIVYLSQAQYAELITNGTITVNGVTVTYDENDIYVTPQAEPVTDVRVNGTSVASNGVANIPVASSNDAGVIKISSAFGHTVGTGGVLVHKPASDSTLKNGTDQYDPVVSKNQHTSTFYGLAKAAGHDEASSTESLGTYTPEAKGAIQQMLGVSSLLAPSEPTLVASKAYAVGDVFTANGKLYKVTTAIAATETIVVQNEGETVNEHNAEETSLSDGFVKKTDYADSGKPGIVQIYNAYGITKSGGYPTTLQIHPASDAELKAGTQGYRPVVPSRNHTATFYGLAKAAGDTTQSQSSNAVGTYTDEAKAAIKNMLGIVDTSLDVTITSTTPTITASANTRYICGEVSTLSFTPSTTGICEVIFTSGTTATVLTLPNTVKMPSWFDSTSLEANTTYEISITDGVYGVVALWS